MVELTRTDFRGARPRLLAVVSNFKWNHIDYLTALALPFDVEVAWSGEGHEGAADYALAHGMRGRPVGRIEIDGIDTVRARLADIVAATSPDVVHVLYYHHERLTLLMRQLIGRAALLVFECRDPLTTLTRAAPGGPEFALEREALRAADAHVFVTRALRAYLERTHDLDLSDALIVPQAFAASTLAPPAAKLSTADGRFHVAIVGTADPEPGQGRWYGDIIRRLVGLGLVVHSHFHETEGASLAAYQRLDAELADYHHHPTVPFRPGTALSRLTSRYDLMGVFHELEAPRRNESATLAVCLPTKAVSGWAHGGIPVACFGHYVGIVELIEELGIGFVLEGWNDLAHLAADRDVVARATERCLAARDLFTHERHAARIRDFVDARLGGVARS